MLDSIKVNRYFRMDRLLLIFFFIALETFKNWLETTSMKILLILPFAEIHQCSHKKAYESR